MNLFLFSTFRLPHRSVDGCYSTTAGKEKTRGMAYLIATDRANSDCAFTQSNSWVYRH